MAQQNMRKLRHTRVRKKISGTPERPRLSLHFSGRHISAQVIDDKSGTTLAAVNTTEKDLRSEAGTRANAATAEKLGKLIAERAAAKNVRKVVLDRGGNRYHGKVKAFADAAREAGFEF
jgi:large subunit ribosomal protein L18